MLDICRVEDEVRASKRRVQDLQKQQHKAKVLMRAAERAAPELVDDPGEVLAVEEPAGAETLLMSEQWAAEEPDTDDEPIHQRVFFPNAVRLVVKFLARDQAGRRFHAISATCAWQARSGSSQDAVPDLALPEDNPLVQGCLAVLASSSDTPPPAPDLAALSLELILNGSLQQYYSSTA